MWLGKLSWCYGSQGGYFGGSDQTPTTNPHSDSTYTHTPSWRANIGTLRGTSLTFSSTAPQRFACLVFSRVGVCGVFLWVALGLRRTVTWRAQLRGNCDRASAAVQECFPRLHGPSRLMVNSILVRGCIIRTSSSTLSWHSFVHSLLDHHQLYAVGAMMGALRVPLPENFRKTLVGKAGSVSLAPHLHAALFAASHCAKRWHLNGRPCLGGPNPATAGWLQKITDVTDIKGPTIKAHPVTRQPMSHRVPP